MIVDSPDSIVCYRGGIPKTLVKFRRMKDGTVMIVPARLEFLRPAGVLFESKEELRQTKISVHPSNRATSEYSLLKVESLSLGERGRLVSYIPTFAIKKRNCFCVVGGYRFANLSHERHDTVLTKKACAWLEADLSYNTILAAFMVTSRETELPPAIKKRFDCYTCRFDFFSLHFLARYLHIFPHNNQFGAFFGRCQGGDYRKELEESVIGVAARDPATFTLDYRTASAQVARVFGELVREFESVLNKEFSLRGDEFLYLTDFGPHPFPLSEKEFSLECHYDTPTGIAIKNLIKLIEIKK